jgi:hypothetical protein
MNNKYLFFIAILSIVLLSGCVEMSMASNIKNIETYDLSFKMSVSAEMAAMSSNMGEDMIPDPSVADRFEKIKDETSVTLKFTDLKFGEETKLLLPNEDGEEGLGELLNPSNFIMEANEDNYKFIFKMDIPGGEQNNSMLDQVPPEVIEQFAIIEYTVDVFDKIIETNGEEVTETQVLFKMDMREGGEYYIIFEKPSSSNWFGWLKFDNMSNQHWLMLILGIIIIVLIILLIIVKPRKKATPLPVGLKDKPKIISFPKSNSTTKPVVSPSKPETVDVKIKNYVTHAREIGIEESEIRGTLMKSGYSRREIDLVMQFK